MSNSKPYVKWFGRDWLGDPLVRMLHPSEKGVWVDLLCHMMQAEPYGHLAVNGKPMEDEDAARLCSTDIATYKGCLSRIESLGVSSRTPTGMLYSRRLVRDHELYLIASESGAKGGGNPALKSHKKRKKPEGRIHKPEATKGLKAPIKGGNVLQMSDAEFITELSSIYTWVDVPRELQKMRAWLLANPGRVLTKRFAVKWLNKSERPLKVTRPEGNHI
jgi:hypothetical protein